MLVIRRLFGTGTNCIAPSGLPLLLCLFPGLAPWAFLSRPCGASFAPETSLVTLRDGLARLSLFCGPALRPRPLLQPVEPAIDPRALEQLLVPARLHDRSVLDDHDLVGIPERREPVRDQEYGPALRHAVEGLLDVVLRLGVQVRGGLVEDQEARAPEPGPGDSDALLLSARKLHAALPHRGRVAARQRGGEAMRVGVPRGLDDVF